MIWCDFLCADRFHQGHPAWFPFRIVRFSNCFLISRQNHNWDLRLRWLILIVRSKCYLSACLTSFWISRSAALVSSCTYAAIFTDQHVSCIIHTHNQTIISRTELVQPSLYSPLCTALSVQPSQYSPLCTAISVQPSLYNPLCTTLSVHLSLYIPLCTALFVQPAMYIPLWFWQEYSAMLKVWDVVSSLKCWKWIWFVLNSIKICILQVVLVTRGSPMERYFHGAAKKLAHRCLKDMPTASSCSVFCASVNLGGGGDELLLLLLLLLAEKSTAGGDANRSSSTTRHGTAFRLHQHHTPHRAATKPTRWPASW